VGRGDPAGGSLQLVELIEEYGGAELDYELLRLGIDLPGDVLRDQRVSPRRVLWLAEQMPSDSAVAAALAGNRAIRDWRLDPVLLTGIFNRLGALIVATIQPHTKKRVPMPKPFVPPLKTRRQAVRVIDKLPIPPVT
jgi:hypothetical protein